MKLRHVLAFSLLAAASTASFADTFSGPVDLSSGNASFGRNNAIGTFTDTYTFTLAGLTSLTGSATSSASGTQDLDFTSLTILNSSSVVVATFAGNFGNDTNEFYSLAPVQLAAGAYSLVVTGLNSPTQASYAGTLAVTAVPEPASGALALAGLGAIGFLVRRRRPT